MAETRPAYVGSGIDWEQKEKMDMAKRMIELSLAAAEEKSRQESQKQDILKQWLNPPQNFAGQSDVPVNLGGFSSEQPGTGQTGPMQQVGIGPMGMIPAGNVTIPGPQLAQEQVKKKGKAERLLLGLSEESPEDKRAAEFQKMRELEREKDERQEIYLQSREKREQAKLDALLLKSERDAIAKEKYNRIDEYSKEIRLLEGKQMDIEARYNLEYNKALDEKGRNFILAERDKLNNRIRQQMDDLILARTKILDPEGYQQLVAHNKLKEEKANYERSVAQEIDSLPFLDKQIFNKLAQTRKLDETASDIYDISSTVEEAKQKAKVEKGQRQYLYELGLTDESIDQLANPKSFSDYMAKMSMPGEALSIATGGVAVPAGGGALLRSLFGGGKGTKTTTTAAKGVLRTTKKGSFKSSMETPGWKPIQTVEPGWTNIPMGPTTPQPIRGLLPSQTTTVLRGTRNVSETIIPPMDQIVRQLSGLYRKTPTPQVKEALGRVHALRMEAQGFRKIDPEIMKILEERSGLR